MSPNDWDSRGYPYIGLLGGSSVKCETGFDLSATLIPLENYLKPARIFFYHILIPALLPHTDAGISLCFGLYSSKLNSKDCVSSFPQEVKCTLAC